MFTTDDFAKLPISVVIPTLGGMSLVKTLNHLNTGPKVPTEILICIPETHLKMLRQFHWDNVKLLTTICKGQVSQRLEGFKEASQPFVMQLDDDIDISSESLSELIEQLIALGKDAAVAPVYLDEATGKCMHRHMQGCKGLLSNSIGSLVAGAPWGLKRMGCITPAGTNYGVDIQHMKCNTIEVEWVPGGCVLHHHSSLCAEAFYPFPGKAYCEDLIHSAILKQNGVRLYVVKTAKCKTNSSYLTPSWQELKADMRARRHFIQLTKRSTTRFLLWYLLKFFRSIFRVPRKILL